MDEQQEWGTGRITTVVVGSMLALLSIGLLVSGGALRVTDGFARQEDGYLMSSPVRVESPGHAVTSPSVELARGAAKVSLPERWLGTVKVEADPRNSERVFVGVARTRDVATYLAGVAHSSMVFAHDGSDPRFTFVDGGPPDRPPADETFWLASATGAGRQTMTWPSEGGDWTLVVMDAEGTAPVAADVTLGATAPIIGDLAVGMLVAGAVLLAISVAAVVVCLRRRRRS